ncbi:MAG: hypothetical protein MJD61_17735 [Proteobacteria bacterium]|nr:hypothetical protein [Pseudomonadota bacterium]
MKSADAEQPAQTGLGSALRATRWLRLSRARLALATAWLLFAVGMLYMTLLAVFFAGFDGPIGFDDGYVAAFAERLIAGRWLPYVDAVSLRGPVLYWASAISQLLCGRFSWLGVHVLVGAAHLTTMISCFALGLAVRRPLVGAIASGFEFLIFGCVMVDGPAWGVTGEPVAKPLLMLAVLMAALAVHRTRQGRNRCVLLFLGGTFAALAGLTKQTCIPLIAPLLLWAMGSAVHARWDRRRLIVEAGSMLAGWLAPWAAVLSFYAAHGELYSLYYWTVEYVFSAYAEPYDWRSFMSGLAATAKIAPFASLLVVLLPTLSLIRCSSSMLGAGGNLLQRYAATGFEATVVLLTVGALAGGMSHMRFWGHHFIHAVPLGGLLLGLHIESALRFGRARVRQTAQIMVALCLAAILTLTGHARYRDFVASRRGGGWTRAYPAALCQTIHNYSRPDEPIVVWGWDADLYIACKRLPGTRFVFSSPLAGIMPPFWHEAKPERIGRGARRVFLNELKRNRPALVLDMPAKLGGFSIARLPRVAALLRKRYCALPPTQDGGRTAYVWRRRDAKTCAGAHLPLGALPAGSPGPSPRLP